MAGRKQDLTPPEQKKVVALIRRLSDEAGNHTELSRRLHAKGLGISQQTLGKYLSEPPLAVPGFGSASLVAQYAGLDVFDVIERRKPRQPTERPLVRETEGWAEALVEARRKYPRLSQEQLEDVGDFGGRGIPELITVEFLKAMVDALALGRERAEAETNAAKRELAAERKKRGQ